MNNKVLCIIFALCVMAACFMLMDIAGCVPAIGIEEGFEHQVYRFQHPHDKPTPIEARP